jgi:hypothetical protein
VTGDVVSCVSATYCLIAGDTDGAINESNVSLSSLRMQATASIWNGKQWESTILTPSDSGVDEVESASCLNRDLCLIGGVSVPHTSDFAPFVSLYRGTGWTTTDVFASTEPITNGQVLDVKCASENFCLASGDATYAGRVIEPALAVWNGERWDTVDVPSIYGGGIKANDYFDSVSCTSSTFCDVVGAIQNSRGLNEAIVASLRGTSWSFTSLSAFIHSAQPTTYGSAEVDCVSTTFCVIGGETELSTNGYSLHAFVATERDGHWSVQSLAARLDVAEMGNVASVDCLSDTFCAAAGSYGPAGGNSVSRPFAYDWNGRNWTSSGNLHLPSIKADTDIDVQNISCGSTHFCALASYQLPSGNNLWPMVSTFNGKTWSTVVVAGNIGSQNGYQSVLNEINCPTASFCMGVGTDGENDLGIGVVGWDVEVK